MYTSLTKQQVLEAVATMMENDDAVPVSQMASELNVTEGEITFVLPSSMVTSVPGEKAQQILEALPTWGKVTTIVHSFGSIFEYKAPFPKGKVAHGYYNLMGREGELHGHLRLDLVEHVALVSKPFRKMASHYIGFYDKAGECVFKVYLGRDKKRQLFPEQIEKLEQLKKEFA
ncbi:heme utilization cystosolic carrier protein HutX [Vibrio breoganii]|uniref:heme utilization cystosolic carrier protein HutX n=1 Tax=Vibrio breoganii TaxID=553239 RepID=UPI000307C786|nr:heme utilization cystosolic carrier protein HutX [Vibrio breoganii]OED96861.1 HuvX protein [Vibrio breoganii ZF-29]PMH00569.1 HuvX protein [Vibrio breoganii]PMH18918.1 HuvX protein [Vibrio breoganii]PMJ46256.1 HuvX protein [Vibrio breoganii]PMK19630.1 HuvX protein [Vibrio breoganii]